MSQIDVYPSPDIPSQTTPPHSNGSFAPVLIVLAVILVLVIVSVVLGRLCNRRCHSSGGEKYSHSGKAGKGKKSNQKDSHNKFHHHQQHHQPGGGGGDHGDIEFGFDKRFSSSKVASNNVADHPHFNFKVPKMAHNNKINGGGGGGEPRGPHVRFADDHIEFRTGA